MNVAKCREELETVPDCVLDAGAGLPSTQPPRIVDHAMHASGLSVLTEKGGCGGRPEVELWWG